MGTAIARNPTGGTIRPEIEKRAGGDIEVYLRANCRTMTNRQMAAALGCSLSSLKGYKREFRIRARQVFIYDDDDAKAAGAR
jgi:hypothetical protein